MGGKDSDQPSDLDRWIEAQRAEINKMRDELLGQGDKHDKGLRGWTDDSSSPLQSPFEKVKSFVESNFSILSDGLRNFPSNVSALKAKMQEERAAMIREEREISWRWTRSRDSPDYIRMQIDRLAKEDRQAAEQATEMLLRESYLRNEHVPPQKIIDLYKDNEWDFGALDDFANPMLSFGGACYYKEETVDNLPSTARWGCPKPRPQWLSVDWFKRSPYSPVRLEPHPNLGKSGANWRAAFEDLLCSTLDKPMVSEEKVGQRMPHGKPQTTYRGPGLDWMLSLQCRGILPPQIPSLYAQNPAQGGYELPPTTRINNFFDQLSGLKTTASMNVFHKRDFNRLIDEVATQSEPETQAELQPPPQTSWRVPDTEQDLYDEMLPKFDRYDHYHNEATSALSKALSRGDVDSAARCLDEYYEHENGVERLITSMLDRITEADEFLEQEDTLLEAVRRSSLPESNPWKQGIAHPDWDQKEQEECERQLLNLQNARGVGARSRDRNSDEQKKDDSSQTAKPDILSQLTTTQTTRLPDGTVTTKVILKQKFADGREEEHESVHTTHEDPSKQSSHRSDASKNQAKEKKGGWFWT